MNDRAATKPITVTVKVFGGLRESFQGGSQQLQLPASSNLAALLQHVHDRFPDLSAGLKKGLDAGYLNILVNGRNIQFLQGYDTPLHDEDIVAFLPPVGGG